MVACGSCKEEAPNVETPVTAQAPLLEQTGALAPGQGAAGRATYDVPVQQGDQLQIVLTSSAFDPALEVTPPGAGALRNDDWQGSRAESRLQVVAAQTGVLKVTVTSPSVAAAGAYQIRVDRIPAVVAQTAAPTLLPPGGSHTGELAAGDETLPDGRFQERVVLAGADAGALQLQVRATGPIAPMVIVVDPSGRAIPGTDGAYSIVMPGPHRAQLFTAQAGQTVGYEMTLQPVSAAVAAAPTLSRNHHQFPTQTTGTTVTVGQSVRGALSPGSAALPTGEPADVYLLQGTPGQTVRVELRSDAFDSYLMVVGPNGQHWENDDSGGTLSSAIDVPLPVAGAYRVVATAYRAGMAGAYELKVSDARAEPTVAQQQAAGGPQVASTRTIDGALAAGDTTLPSGEFADLHELTFAAGERVHLEARSTAFDTYLIVREPDNEQHDNDDGPGGTTNAVIDFVARQSGVHRVTVTSYRPAEVGAYQLAIGGSNAGAAGQGAQVAANPLPNANANAGAAAVTGDSVQGTLAAGDGALNSGEFRDAYTRAFTAGQPVAIRLESSAFDPYLIVTTPSGRQMDNDDLTPSTRNAGVDIPSAENGDYQILVTSYEAGETGPYTLNFGAGTPIPRPSNGGGGGSAGGGQVFGLFAGITDYPDGVGDLPECANDAVKLAEALREANLLDESRQVLLTDAQATVANMRAGFARLASQMGPEDIFVFFYSGHGGQRENSSDPREIDGTDEYIFLHDGPLLDDEMGTLFGTVNARLSVVALDACFSGGFAKDVITQPGRIGFFSSEEDVLSAVAGQFQAGGYLSHFIRLAMTGQADASPHDQVLTVGELSHFLYTQFGQHATDVQLQGAYQHLVVDRGAVHSDQVLWSYR